MSEEPKTCPVCGDEGTYERHGDGWASCSRCGMEANSVAANALEERSDREERTCHYNYQYTYIDPEDTQDDYPSEAFVCDKCRNYVSRYVWEEYGPFEYCPLCGAKVTQ